MALAPRSSDRPFAEEGTGADARGDWARTARKPPPAASNTERAVRAMRLRLIGTVLRDGNESVRRLGWLPMIARHGRSSPSLINWPPGRARGAVARTVESAYSSG